MIPSLAELRKSLLVRPEFAPDPTALRKKRFFTVSGRPAAPLSVGQQEPQDIDAPAVEKAGADTEQVADPEYAGAEFERREEENDLAEQPPDDELAKAVAAAFDPAGGYREHVARLADVSRSIRRLNRAAEKVFGPLKNFRDQMQELVESYEPLADIESVGTFRKGFETLVRLAGRSDRTAAIVAQRLFELYKSLEAAKAFHARLIDLAETFDAAGVLQAQLYELAQAFHTRRGCKLGNTGKVEAGFGNQL